MEYREVLGYFWIFGYEREDGSVLLFFKENRELLVWGEVEVVECEVSNGFLGYVG